MAGRKQYTIEVSYVNGNVDVIQKVIRFTLDTMYLHTELDNGVQYIIPFTNILKYKLSE